MRETQAEKFIELCAPFEGMVYRHCLDMLKNPAEAQDAAQETMLRAFRALPGFLGKSAVPTWLYRIAHHTCLDVLKRPRHQRERTSLEELREGGFEPQADALTPEDEYVRGSEQARLREAMSGLSEEQRVLLDLRYGENKSYDELAQLLGLNPGTVKSRLSRAKDQLRQLMEKNE
ncbi:MAG: RNA polymerase sigma factor [Eubacteriales bacterium]|nr:RNA polymerase sigma factor [Eubacteriales bacterium]